MTGLLEVIALHVADAKRATDGGADRIELVGTMDDDGLSPEPALVGQVLRATTLPVRVMLRLRGGFATDAAEIVRLKGLLRTYRDLGADGVVVGFLNADTEVDLPVMREVLGEIDFGWTFHRAIDSCIWTDRAWRALRDLPKLDQVLTAGSARTVAEGLDELVARARQDPFARKLIMAGGGLQAEHVPWLARAGVTAFHVGSSVRPTGSWKAYIDPELVATWRRLVDDATSRAPQRS
ncbi:copper homeostasis protein CutC [Microlunatus parietis]|uniref:Copper homeostasis protein cutC homolog n=1 Tax=Microlunatus parietis TaxID=682979 RepID=A0A7Y9IB94_9ACTN|nr:copper homeostasis protein CutC [Microlunatus parietis]NYE73463.1 copper homeostasis protein [Microlunatus parietis]